MIVSNYAIRFRVAVFVFIALLIGAGIYSYQTLPREGTPDITIPNVFISIPYPGTAPEEMERLIAIPLEKKLNEVEGIKEIRTTCSDSFCFIVIEFVAGSDIDRARQRVKDQVDLARPDLPDDLEEPRIEALNFSSDVPIFIFTVSGAADEQRLKHLAEGLRDRIERLPGIRQATLSGIREREIRIEADVARLTAYGIPIGRMLQRLQAENVTISAGNLEVAGGKFQVRVPGEFLRAAELRDIVIEQRDGAPVYLRDLADISDTFKDRDSVSRLDGEPCVTVTLKKRAGENAVRLIRDVRRIMDTHPLPPGIRLTVVMDQSDYVAMMIRELENNVFSGFVLVVVVLIAFMGLRNSVFTGVAIPLSMMIAFTVMRLLGRTLNMIVLFSLVLSSGMLVDNAIVIVENIYRLRTEGLSRREAARRGAGEVAWPVISSTATTLAAFAPLMFWPDVMGQFMGFLPWTLIVTLSASLFVALVINPAVCSAFIQARRRDRGEKPHRVVLAYERLLRGALRYRGRILALGFLFLIFSALLYARLDRGVELFPDVDPRNAKVQIRFPQGTPIETTDAAVRQIEAALPRHPDIKFVLADVGGSGDFFFGTRGAPHTAAIHIEFVEAEERTGRTTDLLRRIRESIPPIPGAEIVVEREEQGPPTGAPVAIEISGDDFDVLAELSADRMARIENIPGLVDLRDDYEEALPELRFLVDRDRAALLGLDTAAVGSYLRMAIFGLEAGKFRTETEEFDITLRLPLSQRDSAALLERAYIPVAGGVTVPLSAVGRVEYTAGRGAITRVNQKRAITISGNDAGVGEDKLLKEVRARLDPVPLPAGYSATYTGKNKERDQSGAFLLRAFVIASGLILIILVLQFNSILIPLVIFFSVILSLIGVLWGLILTRMKFGVIMTGLGVISLAGVVVNNAIVLIDCIRRHQEDGLPLTEAVVAAGRQRLRPVLLTAATTILGLIPMAVGWSVEIHAWPPRFIAGSESSAWWAPMAVAVIFGLALATVLTLVLVPLMYSLIEGAIEEVKRRLPSEP